MKAIRAAPRDASVLNPACNAQYSPYNRPVRFDAAGFAKRKLGLTFEVPPSAIYHLRPNTRILHETAKSIV